MLWLGEGGLDFGERACTLGRLNLHVSPADCKMMCSRFGYDEGYERWLNPKPVYSDDLFRMLGSTDVHTMDVSDYEGAAITHDLNTPLPSEHDQAYDTVFDGGTLEHVFNFSEALRSAMRLVKVGGNFFTHQVMNNMLGHGFYCLGPEVFFRALSPENGFEVLNVRIHERYPWAPFRRCPDPKDLKSRLRMTQFGLESMILVHAVRTKDVPIFESWPQQSDYESAWEGDKSASHGFTDATQFGVEGGAGKLLIPMLRKLRAASINNPLLGRCGKYWLNARNFSVGAQKHRFPVDEPMRGGSPPVVTPTNGSHSSA
ncbi:MAG: hypothetical protein Tsb0013_24120 [Phycisphaerales bacterium]